MRRLKLGRLCYKFYFTYIDLDIPWDIYLGRYVIRGLMSKRFELDIFKTRNDPYLIYESNKHWIG